MTAWQSYVTCVEVHPTDFTAVAGTGSPHCSLVEFDLRMTARSGIGLDPGHVNVIGTPLFVQHPVQHVAFWLAGSGAGDAATTTGTTQLNRRVVAVLECKAIIVCDLASRCVLYRHNMVNKVLADRWGSITSLKLYPPNAYLTFATKSCTKEAIKHGAAFEMCGSHVYVVSLTTSNAKGLKRIDCKQAIRSIDIHPFTPILSVLTSPASLPELLPTSPGTTRLFNLCLPDAPLYNVVNHAAAKGGNAVVATCFLPTNVTVVRTPARIPGRKDVVVLHNVHIAILRSRHVAVVDVSAPGAPVELFRLTAPLRTNFVCMGTQMNDSTMLWLGNSDGELAQYCTNDTLCKSMKLLSRVDTDKAPVRYDSSLWPAGRTRHGEERRATLPDSHEVICAFRRPPTAWPHITLHASSEYMLCCTPVDIEVKRLLPCRPFCSTGSVERLASFFDVAPVNFEHATYVKESSATIPSYTITADCTSLGPSTLRVCSFPITQPAEPIACKDEAKKTMDDDARPRATCLAIIPEVGQLSIESIVPLTASCCMVTYSCATPNVMMHDEPFFCRKTVIVDTTPKTEANVANIFAAPLFTTDCESACVCGGVPVILRGSTVQQATITEADGKVSVSPLQPMPSVSMVETPRQLFAGRAAGDIFLYNSITGLLWHASAKSKEDGVNLSNHSFESPCVVLWSCQSLPNGTTLIAVMLSDSTLCMLECGADKHLSIIWRRQLSPYYQAVSAYWAGTLLLIVNSAGAVTCFTVESPKGCVAPPLQSLVRNGRIVFATNDRLMCLQPLSQDLRNQHQAALHTTGGKKALILEGGIAAFHVPINLVNELVAATVAYMKYSSAKTQDASLRKQIAVNGVNDLLYVISRNSLLAVSTTTLKLLSDIGLMSLAVEVARIVSNRLVTSQCLLYHSDKRSGCQWPITLYDAAKAVADKCNLSPDSEKESLHEFTREALEDLNWYPSRDGGIVPSSVVSEILSRLPKGTMPRPLMQALRPAEHGMVGYDTLALLFQLVVSSKTTMDDMERFLANLEAAGAATDPVRVVAKSWKAISRDASEPLRNEVGAAYANANFTVPKQETCGTNFVIQTKDGLKPLAEVCPPSPSGHWARDCLFRKRQNQLPVTADLEGSEVATTRDESEEPQSPGQLPPVADEAPVSPVEAVVAKEQQALREEYLDAFKAQPREHWSDDEEGTHGTAAVAGALKVGIVLKNQAEAAAQAKAAETAGAVAATLAPLRVTVGDMSAAAANRASRRIAARPEDLTVSEALRRAFGYFDVKDFQGSSNMLAQARAMMLKDPVEVANQPKVQQLVHYKICCAIRMAADAAGLDRVERLRLLCHTLQLRLSNEHISAICEELLPLLLSASCKSTASGVLALLKFASPDLAGTQTLEEKERVIEAMSSDLVNEALDSELTLYLREWHLCYGTLKVVPLEGTSHCSYCDAVFSADFVSAKRSEATGQSPSKTPASDNSDTEESCAPLQCPFCQYGSY